MIYVFISLRHFASPIGTFATCAVVKAGVPIFAIGHPSKSRKLYTEWLRFP